MERLHDDFKASVARSFGCAAPTYDGVAVLQRRVGGLLISQISSLASDPLIMDLGAGTGFFSARLVAMFPNADVIAFDIAEPMIQFARQVFNGHGVVGDAEYLPIRSGSVDLIFSNMCIQWCPSPALLFAELARVLKPGGEIIFSTFGPKTLIELKRAWSEAGSDDHVIDFRSEAELECATGTAGLEWSEKMSWVEQCAYPDVFALMRELKALGARNASIHRSRTMTGKGHFSAMVASYPRSSGGEDAGVSASFEILAGRLRRREE